MTQQAAQEAAAVETPAAPVNAPEQAPAAGEAAPPEEMSFDEFQTKFDAGLIDEDGRPKDGVQKPAADKPKEGDRPAPAADDDGDQALKSVREAAREAKAKRARTAQLEQELTVLRQKAAQAEEFQERFRANPVALAREMGMTPRQLSDLFMSEAGPDNELELTRREVADLKQELRDLKSGAQTQQKRQQIQAFAEGILAESSNDQLYPLLSEAPDLVVHSFVTKAIDFIAEKGDDPRDYGKDELVALAEKLYSKSRRRKGEPAKAAPAQREPEVRRAPRSVTTDLTTEKTQLPANFDRLSLEEQEAALNEQFFGK